MVDCFDGLLVNWNISTSPDRISYDSYKIDIESVDPSKDLSMREVYGLDPAMAK